MTFEEFFKKKKINLTALQQAEAALFAEFKKHYDLMGEKSFDHTKKYWFNKLRRLFPAPVEPKVEKVIMENQLAEQTITETLTEPSTVRTDAPKTRFTPRFKAGAIVAAKTQEPAQPAESKTAEEQPVPPAPKPGFTPRFKPGVTAAKPAEPAQPEAKPEETVPVEKPVAPAPKVGFTPRFKAGVTTAKPAEPAQTEPRAEEALSEEKPVSPATKVGFTPRFKAGVTKSAPTSDVPPEETNIKNSATVTPEVNEAAAQQEEIRKQDPDFDMDKVKPRFQKDKEAAQEEFGTPERAPHKLSPEQFIADKGQATEENKVVKPAYKPRFKPPQQ